MKKQRKVIVYIATSLDGYIAKPNDDLSFLSIVEKEGEDYGYAEFISTVDTVIVGRRTYDWVMEHAPDFAHHERETYVISKTARPAKGNTTFYTGDLTALVEKLKDTQGKNIFCDGGAEVVHALIKAKLVDTIIISIVPIMVGDGTKLFKDGRPEQKLQLIDVQHFDTGLVQLNYLVQND